MSTIFLSYRRDDSAGFAGRLMDSPKEHFPEADIFRDIEGIEAGEDFIVAINKSVGSCEVLLALIGPNWLDVKDDKGRRRRLDLPQDWVRNEILVAGAHMPGTDDLPDDRKALTRHNAYEMSEKRWEYDVDQLAGVLAGSYGAYFSFNGTSAIINLRLPGGDATVLGQWASA